MRDLQGRGLEPQSKQSHDDHSRERKSGGAAAMLGRLMQERVLYMMIVNMPSEEEMEEARRIMEQAKAAERY